MLKGSGGIKLKTKKKAKKKEKPKKFVGKGLKIVDEDSFSLDYNPPTDSEDEDVEDLPQIAAVVDDRPVEVQVLESFSQSKWKRLDGNEGKDDSVASAYEQGSRHLGSPPRKTRRDSGDISPPRRSRRDSGDISPPRRSRRDSGDISPPRRARRDSGDISPPRRSRRDSGDRSTLRRNRRDSGDRSPPRRSRRNSRDSSPPRRARRDSGDTSPTRRRNRRNSNDNSASRRRDSPPRRNRRNSGDISPPRRKQGRNSDDVSPPRRKGRRDSEDASPPRRRNTSPIRFSDDRRRQRDRNPARPEVLDTSDNDDGKSKTTLDGKKAGLQKAAALRDEMLDFRKRENEIFEMLPDEVSGRNAKAVKRDRRTEADIAKEQEKQRKEEERKKQYDKWGKGLKQVEEQESRVRSAMHEMAKPLARYKDDEDLDDHLKSIDREGDPMAEYLAAKRRKATGAVEKPKYSGPPPPPNRFNIPPGYRWDGVDRSNGYEKEWFHNINAKKALQEEAYKWSVEDL